MRTQQWGRPEHAPPPPGAEPAARTITTTPDRRYMVVRGRLWRLSNPHLDPSDHARWVAELMAGRRAVKAAQSVSERVAARLKVDVAKRALGERGEVWWTDGAPDFNRHLVENTPYRTWYERNRS